MFQSECIFGGNVGEQHGDLHRSHHGLPHLDGDQLQDGVGQQRGAVHRQVVVAEVEVPEAGRGRVLEALQEAEQDGVAAVEVDGDEAGEAGADELVADVRHPVHHQVELLQPALARRRLPHRGQHVRQLAPAQVLAGVT